MGLTRYTKKIMVDLYKLGRSTVRCAPNVRLALNPCDDNDISVAIAQSRLHNAARRLGVKIKTKRIIGGVLGRVVGYPYNKNTMLYQLEQHSLAEMAQQFGMTESITAGAGVVKTDT